MASSVLVTCVQHGYRTACGLTTNGLVLLIACLVAVVNATWLLAVTAFRKR